MSDEQRFAASQFGDEIRRPLVVAAHPDDLETTSGGTLALLIERGVAVALLGTDGDISTHDPAFTCEALAGVAAYRSAGEARIGEWLATLVALGQACAAEDGRFVSDRLTIPGALYCRQRNVGEESSRAV